ncbi:hypothetical protein [Microlunatus flavus]|uniref:hypothetical protein n=1 Tax=Microlunatus flavus TaxID=1036181 RepID=UPI0011139FE2|nr:hypothetical protein [Microlunatus flavus]
MSGRAVGPTAGRVRLARATLLGGLSLVLASGAHVVGGGTLPGAGVLAVATVLLGLAAAVVTAHRCRFVVLALLLAGQQVLLHALFSVAGGAAHVHLAAGQHGPGHAAAVHGLDPTALHALGAPAMDMASPGWAMVLAHLVATLATAWLLARGEAWLWRAADSVAVAAGLRCSLRLRRSVAVVLVGAVSSRLRPDPSWLVAGPRGPPVVAAG